MNDLGVIWSVVVVFVVMGDDSGFGFGGVFLGIGSSVVIVFFVSIVVRESESVFKHINHEIGT